MGRILPMRKPKEPTISISVSNLNGELDRIRLEEDGTLSFFGRDGRPLELHGINRSASHTRAGKAPKVRSLIRHAGASIGYDELRGLCQYDDVFVIDTAFVAGRETVAAACAVRLRFQKKKRSVLVTSDDHCVYYVLRDFVGNPERAALLTLICDTAFASGAKRRAVVNDSDLGLHEAINQRTEPLYLDTPMPAAFTLLYASADAGKEVLNRTLRFCDRQARQILNTFFAGGLPNPERFSPGPPGSGRLTVNRLVHRPLEILNGDIEIQHLPDGTSIELIAEDHEGREHHLGAATLQKGVHTRVSLDGQWPAKRGEDVKD